MRNVITRAGIVFLVALVVGYFATGLYVAFQLTHVPRRVSERTPADFGLAFSDVAFTSADDVFLSGWLVGNSSDPTVVFVHGVGESRAQHHHLELARHLEGSGFASLLFDLRGAGDSEGSMVSGGFYEREDVIAAAGTVSTSDCKILFGSSLGGAAALLAAPQLGDSIDGVIVDSAYADFADVTVSEISNSLSISPVLARALVPPTALAARLAYGINMGEMIPEEIIGELPYPILIIHGKDDERIPVTHAERLQQAALTDSQLLLIDGAEHTTAYVTDPDRYQAAVTTYLNEVCL